MKSLNMGSLCMVFCILLLSIPWFHIKPLILQKFNHIMDEFIEDVDENERRSIPRTVELNDLKERVYNVLNQFEG